MNGEVLRSLIAKGADVNAKDKDGISALYSAFEQKNQRGVEFLNDHGADFSVLTSDGENLFHALAKRLELSNESDPVVQEKLFELLRGKDGYDVNAKTRTDEETPLHLASREKNLTIVRKLIEHGAEVDCRNTNQETPLHLAVHRHTEEVAKFLLERGANVNSKDKWGRRPLFSAAKSDEKSLVPMLLKWGAYVNVRAFDESPFLIVIKHACSFNAKEMLAYGADINDWLITDLLRESESRIMPSPQKPSRYGLVCRCTSMWDGVTDSKKTREKILLTHWFKLKTAGLPCSEEYEVYAKCEEYEPLYAYCLKEIETMKATFIDRHISIFIFLHMDFDRRRLYVNSKQLQSLVESPELEQQFPNYAIVISASYRETVLWKKLLEPAKRAWLQLTNVILLDECLERIFAYLKNEDLIGMIEHEQERVNE